MGVSVAFDYAAWVATYPEFGYIAEPQAAAYFDIATIYLRNDGTGPVQSAAIQSRLLNMLTAHIAKLSAPPPGGTQPDGTVGRISDATEGSVSVSTEFPMTEESAWFQQTQYGASYWQATTAYRRGMYIPGPKRVMNPPFAGRFRRY